MTDFLSELSHMQKYSERHMQDCQASSESRLHCFLIFTPPYCFASGSFKRWQTENFFNKYFIYRWGKFSWDSVTNFHNFHYRDNENFTFIKGSYIQQQFLLIVWEEIVCEHLIAALNLSARLTGYLYVFMLILYFVYV